MSPRSKTLHELVDLLPEEVVSTAIEFLTWLSARKPNKRRRAAARPGSSLVALAGTGRSGRTDVSERHDHYLAEDVMKRKR